MPKKKFNSQTEENIQNICLTKLTTLIVFLNHYNPTIERKTNQAWCYILVIPALKSLRQDNGEMVATLGYNVSSRLSLGYKTRLCL
jgi:hypothetical protein